ncbi:hypothetical protein [Geovibrio ferrireducens]|uniref:hypothetical protein n=1 Tax=Geovibrio ferrireducens TaxID=46201 RepID=UPI002247B28C|nr:hypothetical protein [Geovibrio ferrireducens]
MEFKFEITNLLKKAQTKTKKHIDGVTINLPFISFTLKPTDIEKSVARELLIRLSDKRVLSSTECCDNCIDNSLTSLQEIRKVLIDSQVKLSDYYDGGLYLLIELIAEGVRQFITYEEYLRTKMEEDVIHRENYRSPHIREQYFSILEQLRTHIRSCLTQIAMIADMETPKTESYLKADNKWLLSIYKKPENFKTNKGMIK